jgi:hypothetical protein
MSKRRIPTPIDWLELRYVVWSAADIHGSCHPTASPNREYDPLGGGGGEDGAFATVAVAAETASVVPPELLAATVTRSVLPASADTGVYDEPVAPLTSAQALPDVSQRFHWYA